MNRKEFIKLTLAGGSGLSLVGLSFSTVGMTQPIVKNTNLYDKVAQHIKKICTTCGTQFSGAAPEVCPICADDRQYVKETGQQWTTHEKLLQEHSIDISQVSPELYRLTISPSFAIGQTAHLIISPAGNLLWDCLPLLDEATVSFIREKGGLKAIAISHPHYYSLMADWSKEFKCPVYLHEKDTEWIMDRNDFIYPWKGKEQPLWEGMRIIHTGGHFPGSTVLHAPLLGSGGSILTGDSIYIARDRKQVSCMYSYPNFIPLPKKDIQYIRKQVGDLSYNSMYGAFSFMIIDSGAKEIFEKSMDRYISILC